MMMCLTGFPNNIKGYGQKNVLPQWGRIGNFARENFLLDGGV